MAGNFTVEPDALRAAGNAIGAIADATHSDVSALIGVQEADAGANAGFATTRTAATCAAGWEQTLGTLGAALALAADTLVLNATGYADAEAANRAHLTPA